MLCYDEFMGDADIKNDIHLHAVATAFVDFNDNYYYFHECDACSIFG